MAAKTTVAKEKATATGRPVKSNNPDRYRLKKRYKDEIVPQLMKECGYKNINQVPKIEKIVLNKIIPKAYSLRKQSLMRLPDSVAYW